MVVLWRHNEEPVGANYRLGIKVEAVLERRAVIDRSKIENELARIDALVRDERALGEPGGDEVCGDFRHTTLADRTEEDDDVQLLLRSVASNSRHTAPMVSYIRMLKNVAIVVLLAALAGVGYLVWNQKEVPLETQNLPVKNEPEVCIQVITPARNPETGEIREFPTPCDVPEGWELIENDVPGLDLEVI